MNGISLLSLQHSKWSYLIIIVTAVKFDENGVVEIEGFYGVGIAIIIPTLNHDVQPAFHNVALITEWRLEEGVGKTFGKRELRLVRKRSGAK